MGNEKSYGFHPSLNLDFSVGILKHFILGQFYGMIWYLRYYRVNCQLKLQFYKSFMLHAPSQEGLFLDSIKPFDENKHENHDDHYVP